MRVDARASSGSPCRPARRDRPAAWTLAGAYANGRLGISGATANVAVPTAVTAPGGVSAWAAVSAGTSHTCGIAANGTDAGKLFCWGESVGGCGAAGRIRRNACIGARASSGSPCRPARRDRPAAWTLAGAYANGRLGISGAAADVAVPTAVTAPGGVSAWAAVSAGTFHTCGIAANGTDVGKLFCWGESVGGVARGGAHPSECVSVHVREAGAPAAPARRDRLAARTLQVYPTPLGYLGRQRTWPSRQPRRPLAA